MISHINRELKILLCKNFIYFEIFNKLFLSEVNIDGNPGKIIVLAQLIFNKTLVRIFYILRQVREEHKLRCWGWQLHTIFNFHVFSFQGRWRCTLDNRQHQLIEFRGRNTLFSVFEYFHRCFLMLLVNAVWLRPTQIKSVHR